MPNRRKIVRWLGVVIGSVFVSVLLVGCGEPDDRLAEFALDASRRQAKHNQIVTEANHDLAQGSKVLVSADAVARKDLVTLQRELHADLDEIGRQRDVLEAERVLAASQRRQESSLGGILFGALILLACLTPLVLAGLALRQQHAALTPAELQATLIEEVADGRLVSNELPPDDYLSLEDLPRLR